MNNFDLSQVVGAALGMPHKIKIESYINGDELFRTDIKPSQKGVEVGLKVLKKMYSDVSVKVICDVYPNYAADMNMAWLIIEAMQKKGFGFSYQLFLDGVNSVRFWDGKIHSYFTRHKHVPTAILLNANDAIHAKMALGVWDD